MRILFKRKRKGGDAGVRRNPTLVVESWTLSGLSKRTVRRLIVESVDSLRCCRFVGADLSPKFFFLDWQNRESIIRFVFEFFDENPDEYVAKPTHSSSSLSQLSNKHTQNNVLQYQPPQTMLRNMR